jgi:hypothetical protein
VSRPTKAQFERVAATIAAMKFYPGSAPGVRLEVLDLLGALVTTAEDLESFRLVLRDRVPEWPGLGELRAIYCTLRKPRTGPQVVSGTPGFTGADLEADYRERVAAAQEQRLLEWKAEARRELGGAPDRELTAAVAQLVERMKLQ